MKIKSLIKIFIAIASIYLLSKYNFLDFSYLLNLDFFLSLKIISTIIIIIFLGSLKWFFLLKIQNQSITYKATLESYYLGYALNYILFGIAGDVIKTVYLIKNKENKIGISMSVVLDRLIGLFSMLILILICLPKIFSIDKSLIYFDVLIFENVILYYSFLFLIVFIFFILIRKMLNSRRVNKIILLYFYRYKNKFFRFFTKIIKVLFSYRKSSKYLLYNLVIAIVLQIIIAFSIFLICSNIIQGDLSYLINLMASLVVQIVSVIPLSPGNIGVGEAAFSQVMYALNQNILLQYATVYFIFRIFNMLCSIPGVIIYYLVIKKHEIKYDR
tara:strand:- start:1219 stop:2205 length:987 start_codon:yes stop_codon:yes gene_type:complete